MTNVYNILMGKSRKT